MTASHDRFDATASHLWDRLPHPLRGARAIAAGLALTGLTTAACHMAASWLPFQGVAMVYLLMVVGSAVAFGLQSGLVAAVSAFLAYNYFFLQPLHTFAISDPGDLVSLLVFFGVAAASGSLAGRLRDVAERARDRANSLQRLNVLADHVSAASTVVMVAEALAREAAKAASGDAVVVTGSAEEAALLAGTADAPTLSSADWQAAQRCIATRECVYPSSPGWPGPAFAFYPIAARDRSVAALGVRTPQATDDACDATLRAMAHSAAVALERLALEAEKAAVQKEAEAERLRGALLSSVSHDIKTPLAAIQGAVTSLRELGEKLPDETKADLLLTIEEEAERLLRFVTNLLDMARLQSGAPGILKDWLDLKDIVSASVLRARRLLPSANIRLETSPGVAIVRGDETLVEHVVLNVIENAVSYSSANDAILVQVGETPRAYVVIVEDNGAGISGDDLPRIFDKFFRGAGVTARGSGLGLAICREVMTAFGGSISAESPVSAGRGTRITLEFPKGNIAETQPGGGA